MENKRYFTGNDDGVSIEEYIKHIKLQWEEQWRTWVIWNLQDKASIWWHLLNHDKMKTLSDEKFEQVFLDRWSRARKKDREKSSEEVKMKDEEICGLRNHNKTLLDEIKRLKQEKKHFQNKENIRIVDEETTKRLEVEICKKVEE